MSLVLFIVLLSLLEFSRTRLAVLGRAGVGRSRSAKILLGATSLVIGVLAALYTFSAFFRFDWWIAILAIVVAMILSSVAESLADHYRLVSPAFTFSLAAAVLAMTAAGVVLRAM